MQNNTSNRTNKDGNVDETQSIQEESQITKSESKSLSSSDESSGFLSSRVITHNQYMKKKKLDLKKDKKKEKSLKNKKIKVKENENVVSELKKNISEVNAEIKPESNNFIANEDVKTDNSNDEENTDEENEVENYSNIEAEVEEDVSEITISEESDKPIKINLKKSKSVHSKKVYNWILEGKSKALKSVVNYLSEMKKKTVNIICSFEWDNENEDYDIKIFVKLKQPQEINFFEFIPLYLTFITHAGVNYLTVKKNIEEFGKTLYKYSDGMEYNYASSTYLNEKKANFERMKSYLGRTYKRSNTPTKSQSESEKLKEIERRRNILDEEVGRKLKEMKKEAAKLYKLLDEQQKYYESE